MNTLEKGCEATTMMDFCSLPRRNLSSLRCRQKTNLHVPSSVHAAQQIVLLQLVQHFLRDSQPIPFVSFSFVCNALAGHQLQVHLPKAGWGI